MKRSYPPGPDGRLLGLPMFLRIRSDPLATLTEIGRTYGDLAHVRMAHVHAYFVNHPDLIHDVLSTKQKVFRKLPLQTRALARIQGDGLVSTEGEFWQR